VPFPFSEAPADAEANKIVENWLEVSVELNDANRSSQSAMKLPNIFEKEVTPQSLSAGSVIFREGERGDAIYIVHSGEVDLYIHQHLVETVGVDGFFGEMALVDHIARSGTAVAKTDCTLIPINQRHFLFMVEETPFFALAVMRAMSTRLRRHNEITAA
jgi:CRP-like cAMP-binding protein